MKISIYSILGQNIKTIVDEMKPAGDYSIIWDGMDEAGKQVTSGLYIYRMHTGSFSFSNKLILIK